MVLKFGAYYRARVKRIAWNNLVDVRYADGDIDRGVPPGSIREFTQGAVAQ